ncbi:hypothetical protein JZ751_009880 [Albula glossodonta]|uniref:Uncharacterized protein n=1 Tax=Albula glossodonta TaxID=121402 RepID=A0A8T2NYW2_9TELE|nr:hypothetical protein JZ751_009880 [Albula glossodonta]
MSSSASGANGLVVVTHVYPQQSPPAGPTASTAAHAPCATPNVPPMLGMFLKGEPKALGFISSGTLTVAASNKLNRCLSTSKGIIGVLLALSILEFIVSICVSGFICRAVSDCSPTTESQPCKMASSASGANGLVVVTHVYPQQSTTAVPATDTTVHLPCTIPNVSTILGKFLKGEPKALGYISSGALSIASSNQLTPCKVKGALGMNIFSTITAGIAIILLSIDFVLNFRNYYCHGSSSESYTYYSCKKLQSMVQSSSNGMSGVLLVFSILEFIISIYVSAFACRAVCDSPSPQIIYMPHASTQSSSMAPGNPLIPAVNTYEMTFPPNVGQGVVGSADDSIPSEKPPEYVEVFP